MTSQPGTCAGSIDGLSLARPESESINHVERNEKNFRKLQKVLEEKTTDRHEEK